jgi:hypothetical protein
MPGKRKRPYSNIDFTLKRVFKKPCFRYVDCRIYILVDQHMIVDLCNAKSLQLRLKAKMSSCKLRRLLARVYATNCQLSLTLAVRLYPSQSTSILTSTSDHCDISTFSLDGMLRNFWPDNVAYLC